MAVGTRRTLGGQKNAEVPAQAEEMVTVDETATEEVPETTADETAQEETPAEAPAAAGPFIEIDDDDFIPTSRGKSNPIRNAIMDKAAALVASYENGFRTKAKLPYAEDKEKWRMNNWVREASKLYAKRGYKIASDTGLTPDRKTKLVRFWVEPLTEAEIAERDAAAKPTTA